MNILLTGMTSLQAGARETTDEYCSPFLLFKQIFAELGHTVTHREVWPGEDLSQFDLALVGIHAFNSIVTLRYKHGALWAASQLPHAVVVDDMQWSDIHHSVTNGNAYWKCSHLDESQMRRWRAASKVSKKIEAVRKHWAESFDLCLFTMFKWGDHERFSERHSIREILDWDPSPWVPAVVDPSAKVEKHLRWVCACLRNQDAWLDSLDLKWPVVKRYKPWIGEKKIKEAPMWRKPEHDLVREDYATSWGNLAYLHPDTAGTGWWRVRFNYVIEQCRTVMSADPREVASLGEPFLVKRSDIEKMLPHQLESLANEQRTVWKRWSTSADKERRRLQEYVQKICLEGSPIE